MLEEKQVCELVGHLGTAAAMLLEDRHLDLVIRPPDLAAAAGVAALLEELGAKLTALGAAAAVLVRKAERQKGPQDSGSLKQLT